MTMVASEYSALDIMFELILEDGSLWGKVACDLQIDDVEAIFSKDGANKHFETRPRGGSKTTDIAGLCVAWLRAAARPRARAYCIAANLDQAAEIIDAATGFIERTPLLDGLACENERIVNEENGAWVRVLPASAAGAWGKRDVHLFICDEFAQWPTTRGAKSVWTAVRTTVQKTPGCQLVILTSAGEPSHWSFPVWTNANSVQGKKDGWRPSAMPGPVPWQNPEELESLRNELLPSEYDRLILNIWSEDEDRAVSEEDFEKASQKFWKVGKGWRIRNPKPFLKYRIAVDIGILNDATVIAVGHIESKTEGERSGTKRVVVDHLERWQGSKKKPLQLQAIEDRCVELSQEYNGAPVDADPDQFMGNLQSLVRRGVKAKKFDFGTTSVGQLATALVQVFRNEQIQVPGAPELKEELLRVRLRESSPGVTRLDHDRGAHDDQAVTIGLLCHLLLGKAIGGAQAFRDFMDKATERRDATAENPETGDSTEQRARQEVANHHRILSTGKQRAERTRGRAQQACVHRWRPLRTGGVICAFGCGVTKDVPGGEPPAPPVSTGQGGSLPYTDFQVRTGNPKALDETVQLLGPAVVIDGSWDGEVCTVRVLAGDPDYIKFAIDHQGYGEVVSVDA